MGQFGIMNTGMIDAGINVNMQNSRSIDHDGSVLDYCRLKDLCQASKIDLTRQEWYDIYLFAGNLLP